MIGQCRLFTKELKINFTSILFNYIMLAVSLSIINFSYITENKEHVNGSSNTLHVITAFVKYVSKVLGL